jgi:hypothetical protein
MNRWFRVFELLNAPKWFRWVKRHHPEWTVRSDPSSADPSEWPRGFSPRSARVFAHNEIFIEGVSPLEVHDLMIRPNGYRDFYPNAGEASTDRLTHVGQTYTWSTFGVRQESTVTELTREPTESRISWLANSLGTEALHRWIFRAEGNGTRVITEECQIGWVAALPSPFSAMATALPALHELWLNGLRHVLVSRKNQGNEGKGDASWPTIRRGLGSAPPA